MVMGRGGLVISYSIHSFFGLFVCYTILLDILPTELANYLAGWMGMCAFLFS